MALNELGLHMTAASRAAVDHFDRAVDALLHFRPEMLEEASEAARADPRCAMAAVLEAYLRLLSTGPADAAEARARLSAFRDVAGGRRFLPREEAHLAAAQAWASGDIHGASRVLRAVAREHPHAGPLTGMLAFGLEEAGEYDRAEDVGRSAVARDPRDVWGIHAVAHSLEMRARVRDGLRFFEERQGDWGDGNVLAVHNWWHCALFKLEAGDLEAVRRIYDARIHHEGSAGLALELLDAAALLWRLLLAGHDEPARWRALVHAWDAQVATPFYAFNDLHAVMAWAAAGDLARVEQLLAGRERYLAAPRPGASNYVMTARIGLPACHAVTAFTRGRYAEVLAQLYPIRHHLNEFGGSHAQRDVLQRTLLEAALRAGRQELAASLVRERIHARPDSPYNWRQRARVSRAAGDEPDATDAERRAADLEHAAR
jgi:hypothetical protein